MKKLIKITVLSICIIVCSKISMAQFNPNGIPNSVYLQPTYPGFGGNDQLSVGIGDFATPGLYPNSFLHINSNLISSLPSNGSIASYGEVFRTDCPVTDGVNDISTFWRMFRGGIEYGAFFNLNKSEDGSGKNFYVQASDKNGDLYLNAGGRNNLMIVKSNGFVGIATLTPKTALDVNGAITAHQIIITNGKDKRDLVELIEQLQNEVSALKKQILIATK